jgi:hypothetical protein
MIGRRFVNEIAALEYWRRRKVAYQLTFKQGGGDAVLADLADFCHAFKTTEAPGNDRLSALREGRRQVWLRILHHLELTPAQLSALYRDIVNDTGDE